MAEKQKLLIAEPPLMVLPSLATELGLEEAIVLQQLHYWLQQSQHVRDGQRWVFNTYEGWREQFPFLSERTIRRIFKALEERGVVRSAQYNSHPMDRTKWYTIVYEAIPEAALQPDERDSPSDDLASPSGSLGHINRPTSPHPSGTPGRLLPETTTETTIREDSSETSSPQKSGHLHVTNDEAPDEESSQNAEEPWPSPHGGGASPQQLIAWKKRKKTRPKGEKETYGELPYAVQEEYRRAFFAEGYLSESQRQIAFAHAKQFVEGAKRYGFRDPPGLMELIAREMKQDMQRWFKPGMRVPTIASLAKRIPVYAQRAGKV